MLLLTRTEVRERERKTERKKKHENVENAKRQHKTLLDEYERLGFSLFFGAVAFSIFEFHFKWNSNSSG